MKTRSKGEGFIKVNIWNPIFKTPSNNYKNAKKSNKKPTINLSNRIGSYFCVFYTHQMDQKAGSKANFYTISKNEFEDNEN